MGQENKNVHSYVQRMIAGTNGKMYVGLIDKLDSYPIPDMPISPVSDGLLLDIGCGWGRWMVSAAKKGYTPIGVDISLEAALAAKQVLKEFGYEGHVVVADLNNIPFKSSIFDLVWSYSVIQHAHRKKAYSCIEEVHRVLKPNCSCVLEFPTKYGIRNSLVQLLRKEDEDDYDSWCVRYYSISELSEILNKQFGDFKYWSHCYLGIGIQPIDLKYVSAKYKPIILTSMLLASFSKIFPPLRLIADSIYVRAKKKLSHETSTESYPAEYHSTSNPGMNVATNTTNLFSLLCCPVTKDNLILDQSNGELISRKANLAFPIINSVPVLLEQEARRL